MSRQHTAPLLTTTAVALWTALSCAQNSPPPLPEATSASKQNAEVTAGASDPQLRVLRDAIAADRERLIALVTEWTGGDPALREDPQLREIAERLPRLEEELRRLEIQQQAKGLEATRP